RWAMHGFDREHKRFWRQVILWLAKKEDSDDAAVWLQLVQRRFSPGSKIDFACGARSPEGEVLSNARLEAKLLAPDGSTRPIPLTRQTEQSIGSLRDVVEPGDYTIVVSATAGEDFLGEAKARFT